MSSKQEHYGVKIFMFCESETGYMLNSIVYTKETREYPNSLTNLHLPFDNHKSPSKVVFSLFYGSLNKGYCMKLRNCCKSFE